MAYVHPERPEINSLNSIYDRLVYFNILLPGICFDCRLKFGHKLSLWLAGVQTSPYEVFENKEGVGHTWRTGSVAISGVPIFE